MAKKKSLKSGKASPKLETTQVPEWKDKWETDSGIPVKRLYGPWDLEEQGFDYWKDLGEPGHYPFTRSLTPGMYRSNLWAMVQYAGYGSAAETNRWFKYLLDQGATGLSLALDLPTQIGYDSDSPMATGEVGKVGVHMDSLRDIEIIFDGIAFDKLQFLSTTANAIGPIYLAWVLALSEKRGFKPDQFHLNIQNDVLKEYICRGTQIFPPKAGLKFATDVAEFVVKNHLDTIYPMAFCGYHIRDAGSTAVQEIAFTLINAMTVLDEFCARGLKVDDLAGRYRIFLGTRTDLFEEVAKFRACRRIFAKMMKEHFGAKSEEAMSARLQGMTLGSSFTAQQPLNNIIRGTVQAIASILGGESNLVVTSYDEALALPSKEAATIALRTQQIVAYESNIINTVDPLAGSYYVEYLTNEIEHRAREIMDKIEAMGKSVAAIERAYFQRELAESAYHWQKQIDAKERIIVGVNKYQDNEPINIKLHQVDPETEAQQVRQLKALKRERHNEGVIQSLRDVRGAAKKNENMVPSILEAVKVYATNGEICDVLRDVWGEWRNLGWF
jgi:methylmalonyl-CoA mutase N-terminal domain/subunit